MPNQRLESSVLFGSSPNDFEQLALQTFQFQYEANPTYREWVNELGVKPSKVQNWQSTPCLPIELFKSQQIKSGDWEPSLHFESSGTTQQTPSVHLVKDESLYQQSIEVGFRSVFGDPKDYFFLGLLPSYLERKTASLVYMTQYLMELGGQKPAFYLDRYDELRQAWQKVHSSDKKPFIIGVTFALLTWAEKDPQPLPDTIIVETGGMKGRGPELVREEVHERLKRAFHLDTVHSEYGMTELLSQGWSAGNGIFTTPPWMKEQVRDPYDPFQLLTTGETGVLNIFDLANQDSCAFIATSDIGRVYEDGSFEVLGRLDHSEVRGCNLMVL